MKGVDINMFKFDYDLTFAILLMNANGTIYHRYGGRDAKSAMTYISIDSLIKLMKDALLTHGENKKKPSPPQVKPKLVEEIPAMARKLKKHKMECIHCHMVYEAEREMAQEEKRWKKEEIFKWPLPDQIGLKIDPKDQTVVKEVTKDSTAQNAGLKEGDRIININNVHVRTVTDIQWALEIASPDETGITIEYERNKERKKATIKLGSGWKIGDPFLVSWRAYMWGLKPQPGFGGPKLNTDELKRHGLDENTFAFMVNYIVDWGDGAKFGHNATKAGITRGDIILSANAKSDFKSEMHFQTWFRLTLEPGKEVELEILRNKKRIKIKLSVID